MKKKTRKIDVVQMVFITLVLMCIMIFLFSIFKTLSIKNLPVSRLRVSQLSLLTDGWYTEDVSGYTEEIKDITSWSAASGEQARLTRRLPLVTNQDNLFIENNYNYMKVFVEDLCIYDYSPDAVNFPGDMTGHFIIQIPLDSEMSGKVLSIEVTQPNRFITSRVSGVSVGTGSAYIAEYLFSHLELILSLILMVIVSAFLLITCVWQRLKRKARLYRMFLSLFLFISVSAIWIFTDTLLPQLLWGNTIAGCIVSFFCFMAIPIPALSFVRAVCPGRQTGVVWLQVILFANIIVQGTLYSLGRFSFVELLVVTHALIVLSVCVSGKYLIHFYRKNDSQYTKLLLLSLAVLIGSGGISLLLFYVSLQRDNSRFFRYSFFIFMGILVYICIRMLNDVTYEHAEHQVLKDLAYNDILTGVESRLALEESMEELRNVSNPTQVTLYAFDLNNLKIVNDTYGHKAGDVILKCASVCLVKVFTQYGRVFRIGGDEFIALVKNDLNQLPDLVAKVKAEVENENNYCEYPFMLSGGCASLCIEYASDMDLLLKEADKEMYKDKVESKKLCTA